MALQTNPSAGLNVFVVDEDEAAATQLACLLQVAGCRAGVAFGPAMAVRVARLCPPMLLLLDLKALGSGGQDLVRALRSIRGVAPQALFVGMADEDYAAPVSRSPFPGIDRLICKPLEPLALAAVLDEARALHEVYMYRMQAPLTA